jgi:chemotaxis response regulator CheB
MWRESLNDSQISGNIYKQRYGYWYQFLYICDRILSKTCPWAVNMISDGQLIEPRHVYVMPENVELTIHNGIAQLTPRAQHTVTNHSIDIFFVPLQKINTKKRWVLYFQEAVLMDLKGVKRIHEFNGNVYVQDPRTAHFRINVRVSDSCRPSKLY